MSAVVAHALAPALAPEQIAPALVFGVLYARRCATLRGTSRAVPGWRQACFHGGIALALLTLIFLGEVADELFWAHMAEHLLLADGAALLCVLGLTGPVLTPVLRLPVIGSLRTLAHPGIALVLWAANLIAWHIPGAHEAAVEHDALHALQHMLFVALGANAWLALLGPLPKPPWFGNAARIGYIVVLRLVGAALANAFLFGGEGFYDVYAAGEARHGIGADGDQVAAGAIMMVEESLLTLGLFCWLFLRAAREGEERQTLLDLAAARGVPLDEARATRAVAAGRGDELRARIEEEGAPFTP